MLDDYVIEDDFKLPKETSRNPSCHYIRALQINLQNYCLFCSVPKSYQRLKIIKMTITTHAKLVVYMVQSKINFQTSKIFVTIKPHIKD